MNENISKNIRDDLLLFKNDTLKDLKQAEKILSEKLRNTEYNLQEKLENFDKQFKKLNERIIQITTFIDSFKDVKTNIDLLLAYKTKSENSIIDMGIKLKSLDKEYHDSIYNINNILKSSIIYPGKIGINTKFRTFHDFIDYILSHISQSNVLKEKISKEVNDNKIKNENNIDKIKTEIGLILDKTNSFISNEIKKLNDENKSIFELYNDKFHNLRIENAKFDMTIKDIEQSMNNSSENIKELENEKNNLYLKYNNINETYNQINNEVNILKDKYYSISSYLKKINQIKENNIVIKRIDKENDDENNSSFEEANLNDNNNINDFIKVKKKTNESRLKDYINGKININEFQRFKNRNEHKSIKISIRKDNNIKTEGDIKPILFSTEKSKSFQSLQLFKKEHNYALVKNDKNEIPDSNKNIKKDIGNNNKISNIPFSSNKYSDLTLSLIPDDKFIESKLLKNISINIEGNNITNINTKNLDDKDSKDIFESVKTILDKNSTPNNNLKVNYLSGFPRIITNQGERVIISSHPVFHRHKFTKKINPNIFSLNKTIQKYFVNKKIK